MPVNLKFVKVLLVVNLQPTKPVKSFLLLALKLNDQASSEAGAAAGDLVGVTVTVGVGVAVAVEVFVGVTVGVGVGVAVAVEVFVGVGVGDIGELPTHL